MNDRVISEDFCMYLRKSRADLEAEARGEGETLIRHERTLLDLAKRLKLNITSIYREIVSGETISSRPVMQQLLNEVEQGIWKGVLVMEVERLARGDTIDQGIVAQTFKYSSTRIITPMKVYDPTNEYDEEYFEFGLFMSRREYKTINRRLQRGRATSVNEGKYVGNKPPYGYNRVKLEHQKGFTLEPHPTQADIVKMIFALYTRGELHEDCTYRRIGVALIVRKLNEDHIPPAKGDVWVNSSVQTILRNPVYIGKIRWMARPSIKKMVDGKMKKTRPRAKPEDCILVDGIHPPLIEMKTWSLAQHYLSENPSRPVPTRYITKNSLSGLIECGVCGRKMVRRPYSNSYPETLLCPNAACKNISSQLSYVEERLLQALGEWLQAYKLSMDSPGTQDNPIEVEVKRKSLAGIEIELKNSEKQLDNLHDLLEQGVYSTEKFLERSKVLSVRISDLKSQCVRMASEIDQDAQRMKNRKIFIPRAEKVLDLYVKTQEPALRNELLKEVVEKAIYTKTVNGRWDGKPDDFELVLFPRIPK